MLDAGTIGVALTLEKQSAIRHVLLSHLHFDHIKGLPTFGDNLADEPAAPVVISSIPEVLNGLRTHIFNDCVYPDFLKLPSAERPVFTCRALQPGKPSDVGGLEVTAIEVNHLVRRSGL